MQNSRPNAPFFSKKAHQDASVKLDVLIFFDVSQPFLSWALSGKEEY